jgi:hypothetical protein
MFRLAPGIIVMQFVTIFFPIYEAYRSRTEARNVLGALEEWEDKRAAKAVSSSSGKLTKSSESSSENSSRASMPDSCWSIEMYGMAALETALIAEPNALLHFAATKDFTAESVIFLLQVQSWRAACENGSQKLADLPAQTRIQLHQMAVEIYTQSVSEKTAEFPINIEGPIRTQLDAVFKSALSASKERSGENSVDPFNVVTPFDNSNAESSTKLATIPLVREIGSSSSESRRSESEEDISGIETLAISPSRDLFECFDERVFDAAEKSIKYLVLTKTWRKFVDMKRERSPNASIEGLR